MGKMVLPLITTIITTVISITVNFLLIKKLGLSGLGYGLAVGVTLNAGILVLILKKILGFSFKNSYVKLIRVLGANLAVLIIALICSSIWSVWPQDSGFLIRLLYAVFVVVFTGVGYIGSLRYLKII
jgi:peptidoglycan biosynthesis protein MviN/MurJ (putative lipid II flippase)